MNDRRLVELEQQLRHLQEEVRRLRSPVAQRSHLYGTFRGRTLCVVAVATLLAAFSLCTAPMSEAQAPEEKAHTVKAPFHVLDKTGKVIMAVEEHIEGKHRGIVIRNTNGSDALFMTSNKNMGTVQAFDPIHAGSMHTELGPKGIVVGKDEQPVVSLGAEPSEGGLDTVNLGSLVISKSGNKSLELGPQGMKVYGKSDKPILRIGADPKGGFGTLVLGKDGKALVGLLAEKDVGAVFVSGSDGKPLVELSDQGVQVLNKGNAVARLGLAPSGSGAGYLTLGNPSGSSIIEAGMLPDGRGIARAYPFKPRTGDILVGQNLIIGAAK